MKYLFGLSLLIALSFSCENTCENNLQESCIDQVPTAEDCDAYFVRWFYDAPTNSCSEIGYSGCEQYGFESQIACESCICID